MKQIRGFLVALCIGTLLWGTPPHPVAACSCVVPIPISGELASATEIFSGRVVKLEHKRRGRDISSADPLEVTVEVKTVWKGNVPERTMVVTALEDASCGYPFQVARDYLIYVHEDAALAPVHLCSRTQPLWEATEDLAVLGEGYAPQSLPDVADEGTARSTLPYVAAGFAGAGLILGALLATAWWKRRR